MYVFVYIDVFDFGFLLSGMYITTGIGLQRIQDVRNGLH